MSEQHDEALLEQALDAIGELTLDDCRYALGYISGLEPELVIVACESAKDTR